MTQRIAHISILFSRGRMLGVKRKLQEMAESASLANIPIDFYLLNRESDEDLGSLKLVKIDKHIHHNAGLKIRAFKYYYLPALVPLNRYDALVLRYHYADPSLPRFMKAFQGKIFFEHHTCELEEIWKSGLKFPMNVIQYGLEKYYAPKCLRSAAGIVAVTKGFLNHQKSRLKLPIDMPTLVLPNGALIFHHKVKLVPLAGRLRIVFIADRFMPWHGLERLLASIFAYQYPQQPVELFLVGQLEAFQKAEAERLAALKPNLHIEMLNSLVKSELLELLASCHVAVESLATYKLGMMESSTLKVKLYLEAGIPWISATPDVDVGRDDRVCFLVANDKNVFDFVPIVQWRSQLSEGVFDTVVEELRQRVDWRIKLKTLYSWVTQNIKQGRVFD